MCPSHPPPSTPATLNPPSFHLLTRPCLVNDAPSCPCSSLPPCTPLPIPSSSPPSFAGNTRPGKVLFISRPVVSLLAIICFIVGLFCLAAVVLWQPDDGTELVAGSVWWWPHQQQQHLQMMSTRRRVTEGEVSGVQNEDELGLWENKIGERTSRVEGRQGDVSEIDEGVARVMENLGGKKIEGGKDTADGGERGDSVGDVVQRAFDDMSRYCLTATDCEKCVKVFSEDMNGLGRDMFDVASSMFVVPGDIADSGVMSGSYQSDDDDGNAEDQMGVSGGDKSERTAETKEGRRLNRDVDHMKSKDTNKDETDDTKKADKHKEMTFEEVLPHSRKIDNVLSTVESNLSNILGGDDDDDDVKGRVQIGDRSSGGQGEGRKKLFSTKAQERLYRMCESYRQKKKEYEQDMDSDIREGDDVTNGKEERKEAEKEEEGSDIADESSLLGLTKAQTNGSLPSSRRLSYLHSTQQHRLTRQEHGQDENIQHNRSSIIKKKNAGANIDDSSSTATSSSRDVHSSAVYRNDGHSSSSTSSSSSTRRVARSSSVMVLPTLSAAFHAYVAPIQPIPLHNKPNQFRLSALFVVSVYVFRPFHRSLDLHEISTSSESSSLRDHCQDEEDLLSYLSIRHDMSAMEDTMHGLFNTMLHVAAPAPQLPPLPTQKRELMARDRVGELGEEMKLRAVFKTVDEGAGDSQSGDVQVDDREQVRKRGASGV
eukprot:GHVQ01036086.1.p1 GENE.GHVQ01036086.1~~GHVQ01036086.1.p1  ORF type:complete len:710 (-),score=181.03 GHVQ01036086.1:921-3050(-)